jgi:hypothetical protein
MKKYEEDHYAIYNFTGCPGLRYSKFINLAEVQEKKWYEDKYLRFVWYFLSCIMWIFVLIGILLFYVFCGAAYELIKCYLYPSKDDDEYNDSHYDVEYNIRRQQEQEADQENRVLTRREKILCGFLFFLGLLLQPLYLMFYIVYALMQCYRRMPCWVIYASAY